MDLDLTSSALFKNDNLSLDKGINFIFGKNGTGKSTISSLIEKEYGTLFDVRVFRGFDSVLGSDDKLNAVILGEENKEINQKINEIDNDILEINLENKGIELTVSPTDNDKIHNYYTAHYAALKNRKKKEDEIEKFYTDSAREISKNSKLVKNARSYNKNTLKKEIADSEFLEKDEIEKFEKILKAEMKFAKAVFFPTEDLKKYLESVNEILSAKVEPKIVIEELQNDSEKLNFAKKGLGIHSKGDCCAFCGNEVSEKRFDNLTSYFSADEVTNLNNRIINGKKLIATQINFLTNLIIHSDNYYPDFIECLNNLEKEISILKDKQLDFFHYLDKQLDEKQKYLFEQIDKIEIEIPGDFKDISLKFSKLVEENNNFANNLEENQENAKNKLRYHVIHKLVEDFQLDAKNSELSILNDIERKEEEAIKREKDVIRHNEDRIRKLREVRSELLQKTRNTQKLAENINKKLKLSVSFELVRIVDKEQEFYEVKGSNGEVRTIKELSTGEKNIIAFLYFIEKLNEIDDGVENKDRIIVFDDPMNSNDDTMQYLIVEELQNLMRLCEKKNNSDKIILLTHNVFFYLNCSHNVRIKRGEVDPYQVNNFYRLLSDNKQTRIVQILNKNKDFKTNYEALWHELVFLYNENRTDMMLNPIRRIIETYIVFNGKEDFYKDNKIAKNLFNTNSHYFPDLEADLNGKTREEIKSLMQQCFNTNHAINHFNKHWKSANKALN